MISYVAIPGTGAGAVTAEDDWTRPHSAFSEFARSHGLENRARRATHSFVWSTNLNFGNGSMDNWIAGAHALYYYHVSPHDERWRIPGADTYLIAHSHGGQVALHAAALGLKVAGLITVGTPVVKGMEPVIERARPNIGAWLHLRSRRDVWQILGSIFDGRLGFYRAMKRADRNDWMPKGHGDVLRDPALFSTWVERGWFDALTPLGLALNDLRRIA
jgi:pimeloyl-ACP methyl ester carboxylesterase